MARKVFISYRRSDSADFTVALYNAMRQHVEDTHIFKDINTIQPGQNFAVVLQDALTSCAVVLVVIGPTWLSEHGQRLHEPGDWVRQEIAMALQRKLRVVPVLANGAKMPHPAELPPDLHGLCQLQAVRVDNDRFEYDVARLCKAIGDLVPVMEPRDKRDAIWDNAFKGILLLFMLGSILLIAWAWIGSVGRFQEKIAMSVLGIAGMVGGWAAFTRQRWIELRANQLKDL